MAGVWEGRRGGGSLLFAFLNYTSKYIYPSSEQKTPCAFCSGVASAWCCLLSYAVCFLQRCGVSLVSSAIIYNIVSEKVTRWPVDLFKKEPLKGNSEVHLHTPTKFGEDPSKDLGGVGEQTDRQTDKRCSIYSMIKRIIYCITELKYLLIETEKMLLFGVDDY